MTFLGGGEKIRVFRGFACSGFYFKMRSTGFILNEAQIFCANFFLLAGLKLHKLFEHPLGPGHPGKIPGTSQALSLEALGKQTFEGGNERFDPHPFACKTPTPLGNLRAQKVHLCALFSCRICESAAPTN